MKQREETKKIEIDTLSATLVLLLFYVRIMKLQFDKVHGPIVGEVTETEAVVWYRNEDTSAAANTFEFWIDGKQSDTTLSLELTKADPDADFTSKTKLLALQPNSQYLYKIGDRTGSFKTAGSKAVNFVFGSCIGGQGFGRNPEGHPDGPGFPIFDAIHKIKPDFIQVQGDFIYADNKVEAESTMFWNKGQKYVTPQGADELPIASDLETFRARYKYNLEDKPLGTFLRNTVVFNTWDDHGECKRLRA